MKKNSVLVDCIYAALGNGEIVKEVGCLRIVCLFPLWHCRRIVFTINYIS